MYFPPKVASYILKIPKPQKPIKRQGSKRLSCHTKLRAGAEDTLLHLQSLLCCERHLPPSIHQASNL